MVSIRYKGFTDFHSKCCIEGPKYKNNLAGSTQQRLHLQKFPPRRIWRLGKYPVGANRKKQDIADSAFAMAPRYGIGPNTTWLLLSFESATALSASITAMIYSPDAVSPKGKL